MSIKSLIPKVFGKHEIPVRQSGDMYDPFVSLHKNMNNMFNDFFENFGTSNFDRSIGGFSPSVDVRETDKEIMVQAELPGLTENDIDISLNHNRLVITGEKKLEHTENKGSYHRIERSYGSFHREISLPSDVEEAEVQATFKKGVLNISLPKCESAVTMTKKIPIKAG
jgi:HSP20 family protein